MATEISNPGIKHKDQRVGVFIDVQNMYYSAKALYSRKVNFGEILDSAVAGRKLIRALAYVVRATGEEDPFFEALNQRGIETKERELLEFHGGAKKADWDVGITVDAIRISEVLDVVVIVSGDGDFVELVEYLKHHGKQVEAIAFRKSTSSRLVEAVDDFVDLGSDNKYLIGSRGHAKTIGAKRVTKKTAPKNPEPESSTSDSFWLTPPERPTKKRGTGAKKPSSKSHKSKK